MKAADLTGPDYYHEPMDVVTLQNLARRLPLHAIVVNIGVGFGTSILAMLEARPDLFIFAIDSRYQDTGDGYGMTSGIANLEKSGLGVLRRVAFILGRSQDVGANWPFKVNMVFVDGSHIKSEVLADIATWKDKILKGGLLAFDDYGKPICPGVKLAVDEAMAGCEPLTVQGDIIVFEV